MSETETRSSKNAVDSRDETFKESSNQDQSQVLQRYCSHLSNMCKYCDHCKTELVHLIELYLYSCILK